MFNKVFNKTYVSAISQALEVPTNSLAHALASQPVSSPGIFYYYKDKPDQYDTEDDVADRTAKETWYANVNTKINKFCGVSGQTKEKTTKNANAYNKRLEKQTEVVYPSYASGGLLVLMFFAVVVMFYMRNKRNYAQALFNGATICSVFTAAEIVGWLVINVPIIQKKLDVKLKSGLENMMSNTSDMATMMCTYADSVSKAPGGEQAEAVAEAFKSSYAKGRLNSTGDVVTSRKNLWIPAVGVIFGALAAAALLYTGGHVKTTLRHFGYEFVFTIALVGIVQAMFYNYTSNFPYYGSETTDMKHVAKKQLCKPVQKQKEGFLETMQDYLFEGETLQPTLEEAIAGYFINKHTQNRTDIEYTRPLKVLGGVYLVLFCALSAKLTRDRGGDLKSVLKSSSTGLQVALAGWITELYIYTMVIKETKFVTWPQIESQLVLASDLGCGALSRSEEKKKPKGPAGSLGSEGEAAFKLASAAYNSQFVGPSDGPANSAGGSNSTAALDSSSVQVGPANSGAGGSSSKALAIQRYYNQPLY